MDRGEKVAYYCSELGSRSSGDTHHQSAAAVANNNNNNNLNSNSMIGKFDNEQQHQQDIDIQQQQQHHNNDGQSNNSSGDYPSKIINHFNAGQTTISDQQQQQQQGHSQFVQQQMMTSSSTQPQYLISNSNPQHLTNLNLHQFNQQHHNNNNNNSAFTNQVHSAGYHVNPNHLYQPGVQQQQARALFQHHKSPSMGDDGNVRMPNNQVIFHDDNNKQHLMAGDSELQARQRQHFQLQQQQSLQAEPTTAGLASSQSHSDFTKIRRKSEHLGLTSEVNNLENLDLSVEAMFMPDGTNATHNNRFLQRQQQHLSSTQNDDKMLRTLAVQQLNINDSDKPNNGGSDMSSSGYGQRQTIQTSLNCSTRDSLFMQDNRSEDNIYEEIDSKTVNRYQLEYPIDSISVHSDTWKKKNAKKFLSANSFTRWFSTRKKSSNSQNSDQEETNYSMDPKSARRPPLICLPETIPDNLTDEKLKRRLIVGSIVDSENSYTNSLYRLIFEYKKPLEAAEPPILSANKIGIIFFCLDQILQFHRLFGLALRAAVQEWDAKEMIGDVFTINFCKSVALDYYSGFINNFTNAMETARRAAKSKAFAQFLNDKWSTDKLGFFGSMVKPVQRFPQFILLLSDLLKYTPFNHPDRMPLQRALTELESLADRLNERKRDAERHFAVKQLLKDHLNDSIPHSQRFLLRQDDICLLDTDPSTNTILKSKSRKMYLLNDMLICVSTPSNRLKFAVPLSDMSIIESITPAISNLLAHSNMRGLNDSANAPQSPQNYSIERMECERQSLVHDLEIMMRIAQLVAALRFQYNGLNPIAPEQICLGIREEIKKKEFQMTLIDRSCLQLRMNTKNNKVETLVVQFNTPDMKREWLIDVRLTKLALDRANNPGWQNVTPRNDSLPQAHQATLCSIGQRVPLFVKSLAIFKSDQSHLTCALHYYLRQAPFIGENPAGVLWICNVNVGASSLGALATNGAEISLIHSYELSDSHVTCLEYVNSLAYMALWIGLRQGRIIVIDANSPSEWKQFASLDVQNEVTCIKYFGIFVYVGLINGEVAVFDALNLNNPERIRLSQSPVTCLLPINEEVFACSHNRIWRIKDTSIVGSLVCQNENIVPVEEEPKPNLLAHCGSGIWVSLLDSPIVKLYHAETLEPLVDINVATSIRQVLNDSNNELKITVTSMMATRGLLWIGTNVGMIATLMLPRLQGVPLVSGSINIALHRFLGPVNIMLNLSAGSECVPQLPFNDRSHLKPNHPIKNEDAEAIYGQYADLMNVGDYIPSGRKSGGLGETPGTSVFNLSGMNVSDDSGSSADSGAIYQDGVPRGMRQVQNKAVISNMANQQGQQQTVAGSAQQQQQHAAMMAAAVQNQMVAGNIGPSQTSNQVNDLNHVYDKAQGVGQSSVTYNQGSLNGILPQGAAPTNLLEAASLDRLQQQRQILSASQAQLAASKVDQNPLGGGDYQGVGGGKISNKLYDQPTQLIQQQQQIIQQSRQALNQIDGNMMTNMHPSTSTYGASTGAGPNKTKSSFIGNKTVLVLAGGNGYQRMAMGDNKQFSEHAHCIIWEYKA